MNPRTSHRCTDLGHCGSPEAPRHAPAATRKGALGRAAPRTAPKYPEHDSVHDAARPASNEHTAPSTAAGPPPPWERGRLARFSTNRGRGGHPRPAARGPRERRHRPPGSAAVAPADAPSAPGSRRSRACRERRRRVADRRHAAEPTIADAALRDAAVKRLRGDGKHGDGEPARSSFLVPLSSFLFPRRCFPDVRADGPGPCSRFSGSLHAATYSCGTRPAELCCR
jgi:hypothetical protein